MTFETENDAPHAPLCEACGGEMAPDGATWVCCDADPRAAQARLAAKSRGWPIAIIGGELVGTVELQRRGFQAASAAWFKGDGR